VIVFRMPLQSSPPLLGNKHTQTVTTPRIKR
jgi:hypothetical protein